MNLLLSSLEAARYLGVSRQTLYAYVSRGWVRSETGDDPRSRRYNRLDLERLRQRKEVRSEPARKLTTALSWGVPLLETELTLIDDGQLYYRGRSAVAMARTERFSQAVLWLWNRGEPIEILADTTPSKGRRSPSSPLREFQRCLMELSEQDAAGYDFALPNTLSTGWRILELFLTCLIGRSDARLEDAAAQVQRMWAPKKPELAELLNAALVLSLDHELNASSFTARVVASVGSSLYDVVAAALCALSGDRHGGMSLLCYQLLAELEAGNPLRPTLVKWQRERGQVPGFGHPLYPSGDIRAKLLLPMLKQTKGGFSRVRLIAQASQVLRKPATIDLALAALARAFELPAGSPLEIFALGRIAGWIGHAIEQRRQGGLIRPRARYIGPLPNQ
jgi:citrate synthase